MPFARLTILPQQSAETTARLAGDLTDLIARDLRKRHDLTSVLVESPPGLWTIASVARSTAVNLEVTVTAGTNTDGDKRAFLAAATALLRRHLPDLHPASYCTVREIAGSDWGYDGLSQADRAAAAR